MGFGFGFDEKLEAISPAKDVVDFITKRVLVRWTRLIYRSENSFRATTNGTLLRWVVGATMFFFGKHSLIERSWFAS